MREADHVEVAIIGAGFSGLGMAIRLLKEGWTNFAVLEKADEVGGTWRDNRYPGCACDIPSLLYSFSFEQRANWSRLYPQQPEILQYLRDCADKYGVRPHIRFGCALKRAVFDETANLWRLETSQGPLSARAVVSGMGALSIPAYPPIPGRETFAGPAFHSAEWREDAPLEGKRVAIIGTGASTIQFAPQIAPQVRRLTIIQRTPPWIVPKPDRPLSDAEVGAYRAIPALQGLHRNFLYWRNELRALGFIVNPKLMAAVETFARRHLEAQVADPDLRRKLTPDYVIGCKRVLISNDYYPMFARDTVELVTAPVARIEPEALLLEDGRRIEADILIYGTGFAATEPLSCDFVGREGRSLKAQWAEHGPEAFLGVSAAGFPNLFFLMGPNTGLGHNSMVYMIESQILHAMDALRLMREANAARLEVKPDVQATFNRALQARLDRTVWRSGCRSWYLNEDGKNTTLWPGFTFEYRSKVKRLSKDDYELHRAG